MYYFRTYTASLTRAQRSARFHVMLVVSPLVGKWFCESCGGIASHRIRVEFEHRAFEEVSVTAVYFGRFARVSVRAEMRGIKARLGPFHEKGFHAHVLKKFWSDRESVIFRFISHFCFALISVLFIG